MVNACAKTHFQEQIHDFSRDFSPSLNVKILFEGFYLQFQDFFVILTKTIFRKFICLNTSRKMYVTQNPSLRPQIRMFYLISYQVKLMLICGRKVNHIRTVIIINLRLPLTNFSNWSCQKWSSWAVLKNFTKLTEKFLSRSLSSYKIAASRPATLKKKQTSAEMFPLNFPNFQNRFFAVHLW